MEWLGLIMVAVLLGIILIIVQIKQLDTLIRSVGGLTPDDVKRRVSDVG